MKSLSEQLPLILIIVVASALVYLLAPMLTPFLVGALFAYLVDPLVKRLDRRGIPHILSVTLIFLFLFSIVVLLISFLYPLIVNQIEVLIGMTPQIIAWIKQVGGPWAMQFIDIDALKTSIPETLSKSGWVLSSFLHTGFAAISLIVALVLIPIVTFYLLRDWDIFITGIKNLLPKKYASTIIHLAHECDEVLGAFIRGQLLVMLCLGIIYGVGLTIVGLKLGLIIGLLGGLLSIVPYLGSTFVIVAASIASIVQDGTKESLIAVLIVFLIGQALEGYVLTPYLIGERIGLHPVAVIFAIMAGGTLFGFFGVLLALPVAAILMASFRFFRRKFAASGVVSK